MAEILSRMTRLAPRKQCRETLGHSKIIQLFAHSHNDKERRLSLVEQLGQKITRFPSSGSVAFGLSRLPRGQPQSPP